MTDTYLEALIGTKEGRIKLSLNSFSFFCSHYLDLDIYDHMLTWIDRLSLNRYHQESPRDHGKSTILSYAYPLWNLCTSTISGSSKENIRVLVVSRTGGSTGVSTKVKDAIIEELKTNKKILNDFGNVISKEKGGNLWVRRSRILKDPSLESIGTGGAITGGHYDIIICDDIIDSENSKTELMRKQVADWFNGTLMELLEPTSQIIVVGTRKHYDDLYQQIISNKVWNTFIDVAIMKYPKHYEILEPGTPEYDEIDNLYVERHGGELKIINNIKVYVEGEYEVLWPEKWNIFQLLYNKHDIGPIMFDREKQNDPSGMKGRILKEEWLQYYDQKDLPEDLTIYMGVDLAATVNVTSDYMCLCSVGYSPTVNKAYLLDFYRRQCTFPEQIAAIEDFAYKWSPIRITIESNAYQNAMVQYQHAMNMLPVVGSPTSKDKITRMLAMTPYISTGRILFNQDVNNWNSFLEEYVQFPASKHDDMLDSLSICLKPIMSTGEVSVGDLYRGDDIEARQGARTWFSMY